MMTNKDIINNLNNISYLTNWQRDMLKDGNIQPLPVKITFAINKNKKLMENEYNFYIDQLNELNTKYNITFNEDGSINNLNLTDDNLVQYYKEVEQIQSIEIDIKLHKITEEDFGNYSPTLMELDILLFMMEN